MSEVSVSVVEGRIVCDPDVVQVTAASKNQVSFRLVSAGYTFPQSDAVVMKQPSPDFPEPARTVGDASVQLKDLNRTKGVYPYTVTVLDRNGRPIRLDPGIGNDGEGP